MIACNKETYVHTKIIIVDLWNRGGPGPGAVRADKATTNARKVAGK
jgi:hypothetical protein